MLEVILNVYENVEAYSDRAVTKLSNLYLFFKHVKAQCVPTGDSSGDLITSNRADSTAMERSNVTLSCNYSSATILQCQPYLMLSDPQRSPL